MFTCLPLHPSKPTITPCPITINFTEQSYHPYEATENFTRTAGWQEEQNSTCALCRKFQKCSLCITINLLDRKILWTLQMQKKPWSEHATCKTSENQTTTHKFLEASICKFPCLWNYLLPLFILYFIFICLSFISYIFTAILLLYNLILWSLLWEDMVQIQILLHFYEQMPAQMSLRQSTHFH